MSSVDDVKAEHSHAQGGSSLFASTKEACEERLSKEVDAVEAYLNKAPPGAHRGARQSSR